MLGTPAPSRTLGWLSLSLLVLAAVALAVPTILFATAATERRLPIGDASSEVRAPGDRTWGVYVVDADNSGSSGWCWAVDSSGGTIDMRSPRTFWTWSETETLADVFTTPDDGLFTVECNVRGADASVGPVGSFSSVLIGIAAAAVLGLGSVVTGAWWLARRTALTRSPVAPDGSDPTSSVDVAAGR